MACRALYFQPREVNLRVDNSAYLERCLFFFLATLAVSHFSMRTF